LDKWLFRIVGNPDDRHREDDEKRDKKATADHHLRGIVSTHGGGWSVVCRVDPHGITHTHHLGGEFY
jgi:hypothetical protein